MKTTVTKEVTVCDLCKGEGFFLTECLVCGKEYCCSCEGLIPGCIVRPDVCLECDGLESKVQAICDKFAPRLAKSIKQRDQAIRELKK